MMYFSIPSDFKLDTLEKLDELNRTSKNKKVMETYGQATKGILHNSGRDINALPDISMQELEKYIKSSKTKGIDFNYTINPACFGNLEFTKEGIKRIKGFLTELYQIGVRSLTVTSPSIFEIIRSSGFDFTIKASAICEIASPNRALFYKSLGAKRIVIDPDVTRDFRTIRNICNVVGAGCEIIINNVCIKNCGYKMFHYNHDAHRNSCDSSNVITDFYTNRCAMQKASKPENLIKLNWIRPEDLSKYYDAGIRHFKIQGRQNVLKGDIIRTLQIYFAEDYDGDLFSLITIFAPYNSFQPYIDNKKLNGYVDQFLIEPCNNICGECGYCKKFADKAINATEGNYLNKQAKAFYESYDQFGKEIKRDEKTDILEIDFF